MQVGRQVGPCFTSCAFNGFGSMDINGRTVGGVIFHLNEL